MNLLSQPTITPASGRKVILSSARPRRNVKASMRPEAYEKWIDQIEEWGRKNPEKVELSRKKTNLRKKINLLAAKLLRMQARANMQMKPHRTRLATLESELERLDAKP